MEELKMEELKMTKRQKYDKNLFFIATLWNWCFTAGCVGMAIFSVESLGILMKEIPDVKVWLYITVAAIGLFGYGYYCISRDVYRNRDIIKLGVLGKWVIFGLFLAYFISGDITLLAFSAAVGDLIFSFLFIEVLSKLSKTYK